MSWFVCSEWYIIAYKCIENFQNKCVGIYELDPAQFLSAPGLAWQACLKKTKVKLELLTDITMLKMVEEALIFKVFISQKVFIKLKSILFHL